MLKQAEKLLPLLGIALFAAIIWLVGIDKIISAALSANPTMLLAAALILIPVALIQAFKWHYLIEKQKLGEVSFFQALRWYFIGLFYGAITPAKIGSFMRISLLQKATGKPLGACSASVVLDRMLDVLSVALLAFFGAVFFLNAISGSVFLAFALLLAALILALWLLTSRGKGAALLSALYAKLIPEKLKPQASELFSSFRAGMPQRGALSFAFILSFISWVLIFTQTYIVALALGMGFEYAFFIAAVAVSSIVALLPVTINGLGTSEAALIVLLSPFNAAPSAIVAMSLISALLLTYLSAAVGAAFALTAKSFKPLTG
ncbi:MAG: lysylphosphatidylglycerol synthase transmembrane domain-containing protein [Candidatus Diapherotrites archaeon]